MAKYRKKPVIVEAEQWPGKFTIEQWAEQKVFHHTMLSPDHPAHEIYAEMGKPLCNWGWVATLKGGHIVFEGDYVITEISGEKYPCKPDIFEEIYELVEE